MKKEKSYPHIVGWGGIAASLIIFFNPDIGLVDILPDFIGYMLLCAATAKLSDIDDRISEARALLIKMLYVSLAKFAALFIVYGVIPVTDRAVTTLLVSFVYSSLELFFLLPAIVKLFEGILHLASMQGGEAVYTPARVLRRRRGRGEVYQTTRTESIRRNTILFIIFRAAMRTLPEFASLSSQGYDDSFAGQLYKYLGLFRGGAAVFMLIAGLLWLIGGMRYLALLRRDRIWLEKLNLKYEREIASQTDRPARRAVKVAFGLFGAAAILSLDMTLDNINILPDIFPALALLAGLLIIRKYVKGGRLAIISASLYAVATVAGEVSRIWFDHSYYAESIRTLEAAYDAHIVVCTLTALEAALFALTIGILLFVVIKNIIVRYTGFSMTSNDSYDPSEKIRLLHLELSKKLYLPGVLAFLAAVCAFLTRFFVDGRYIVESLVSESGWMSFLYEALIMSFWQVEFLFTGIFAISFIVLLRNINEQIEYKYMLL